MILVAIVLAFDVALRVLFGRRRSTLVAVAVVASGCRRRRPADLLLVVVGRPADLLQVAVGRRCCHCRSRQSF